MKSSIMAVTILAALTSSLIACATQTDGSPTPASTPAPTGRPTIPGQGGTPGSTSKAPVPGHDNSPTSNIDPCTLLTSADISTFGAAAGTRRDGLDADTRGCRWVASGQYTIQVDVFDKLGVKDIQATGEVKSIPAIGSHQAVQFMYGPSCTVTMAISDTSRVDAAVAAGNDATKACQVAAQVAPLIEPRLPGGN
ncbi:DUF3558 domain-containing protein [Kibdelosporangium philippinense]|uniref:DUF3558 domain-containing protein n=1 Tax=Kibdelosporangium philippinense TaxID=211113 RepID=A0ABS8Z346_9PSEU|nr:DUF3558 family protein [Kibdelosporangium philippinense]MCE7001329.1 DUF3558 domain-containing protein [Kibdelosporangium philippinense]